MTTITEIENTFPDELLIPTAHSNGDIAFTDISTTHPWHGSDSLPSARLTHGWGIFTHEPSTSTECGDLHVDDLLGPRFDNPRNVPQGTGEDVAGEGATDKQRSVGHEETNDGENDLPFEDIWAGTSLFSLGDIIGPDPLPFEDAANISRNNELRKFISKPCVDPLKALTIISNDNQSKNRLYSHNLMTPGSHRTSRPCLLPFHPSWIDPNVLPFATHSLMYRRNVITP